MRIKAYTDIESWALPFSFDIFRLKPLRYEVSVGILCFLIIVSWQPK